MAKNKLIAGIELGSSKIATIIAQVGVDEVSYAREINIVGVSSTESKGIKKGQIVNIEEAVDATVASIEAAERMAGYNLDNAYVAMGGAHIASQNSHGVVAVSNPEGEISGSDVDRVVEAASAVSLPSSRELIHVIPREYIVDGESGVKDPIGMSGVRLEVQTHLVTASGAAVKNLRKAVNEVGVNVNELIFSGLASGEAVLTRTEKELGCCLVDIGGGTTSIAAYTDGSLIYSGVLPIGANNVTNDLAIGLRVSLESADKIKLSLSEADKKKKKDKNNASDEVDLQTMGIQDTKRVSRKTLTDGIIRPRLNEIFTMVRIQLDKENLGSRIPSGIILTGGGAETVGIEESARRMLSLPVRIGKPKGIGGLIDDIVSPVFATPVGLIIYAAGLDAEEVQNPFTSKLKLPSKGLAGKILETIKDLLP
ncbi:cell division protein FtsA [Candidatus Woesebacteria bacterium RIFCSPLOWO2_01_FULL_39_61]|uniref:Cell division protein FtsA n=1 Tax=Candidatus Woesebacteria bacterium RIFCSPHIGHO2_02_FULL_39_13 TaxID=1802505 RepID=A0A1F7YZJ2_9BACT|nr:MAG: cell division protein FtsA [Candidatus Woesebacteria bacterium RIFCSPHIGHO2_01_FULL_39_95]OGM32604.1 MAG: cell division protein FtsA [Candidatus Woesebacteria bacterium RIFCSPHIGHO2_02_FULL_39_13]OGM36401.1 MAG: cell division protein FtsA [Candidatus Woesebacteria bacterium RIFCSPHIGHO2_12_FULL_40_20]OGM66672.1 MAG: cell division protein FtsA [Candidatus Woesebacteria bacterium RIFCSPLOWO2_01_FULL_39_61]OGM72959.1 MAG: cell division protein FtsA [Candidatus Woesebacteria bacterium RIFCS